MRTKCIQRGYRSSTCQPGVSFLEIMIVVIIMAAIAAVVGPMLFGKLDQAKVDQAHIQIKSLSSALDLYHLDNSGYPSTEQGLESLLKKPEVGVIPKNWKGPYLRAKTLPLDPWQNDYIYRSEGSTFEIISLGADSAEGGEGINTDITSGQ